MSSANWPVLDIWTRSYLLSMDSSSESKISSPVTITSLFRIWLHMLRFVGLWLIWDFSSLNDCQFWWVMCWFVIRDDFVYCLRASNLPEKSTGSFLLFHGLVLGVVMWWFIVCEEFLLLLRSFNSSGEVNEEFSALPWSGFGSGVAAFFLFLHFLTEPLQSCIGIFS